LRGSNLFSPLENKLLKTLSRLSPVERQSKEKLEQLSRVSLFTWMPTAAATLTTRADLKAVAAEDRLGILNAVDAVGDTPRATTTAATTTTATSTAPRTSTVAIISTRAASAS